MTIRLYIIILLLISSVINSVAQTNKETIGNYEVDTLKGRHFSTFIKPKNLVVTNNAFTEADTVPTFKKKCGKLKANDKRRKCFGDTFFEIIRKKIRVPSKLVEGKPIEVITKFYIGKEGLIEDIEFTSSNDYTGQLEKNIIKILKKMPLLEPAIINEKVVRVPYSFPVKMSID